MADALLQVDDLRVRYGGIEAVKGVSLEVRSGELVSLIGSNGAGKTTTMKAITGLLPLKSGRIVFAGRDAQGQKFLSEVALAPPDMAKLCHGNADALLKLKP